MNKEEVKKAVDEFVNSYQQRMSNLFRKLEDDREKFFQESNKKFQENNRKIFANIGELINNGKLFK